PTPETPPLSLHDALPIFGDVHRPRVRRGPAGVGDDPLAGPVRVPGLHRGPLVGMRERGEHRVARVDVGEVAAHDLRLAAARPAAEVAAHRIDRLPASRADERGGTPTVLVCEGWPGEVDAHVTYSFV